MPARRADVSILGWVRNLITFYEVRMMVGFDEYGIIAAWLDRVSPGP